MDCEFVGVGEGGNEHMLARCSLVNGHGEILYDKFVRPTEKVVDFRTCVSGIRYGDVNGPHAVDFKDCQADIAALLKNKTLVGHSVMHDLKVLMLSHPWTSIRDTAKCKLLCPQRPRPLRALVKERLDKVIQEGEHSSVEDARAVLQVYKSVHKEWERHLRQKKSRRFTTPAASASSASHTSSSSTSSSSASLAAVACGQDLDGSFDDYSSSVTADLVTSSIPAPEHSSHQRKRKQPEPLVSVESGVQPSSDGTGKKDKRTRDHMNNLSLKRNKQKFPVSATNSKASAASQPHTHSNTVLPVVSSFRATSR